MIFPLNLARKLVNWFTNTNTRERQHRESTFELEMEHKYLEAQIGQLWDYIVLMEEDLARKIAKVDWVHPRDRARAKKAVEVVEEQEEGNSHQGLRIFGGKSKYVVDEGGR